VGKKRFEKAPDAFDLALIEKIEQLEIPYWFPTDAIPRGDKTGEPLRIGITHVHHFYTRRNLWVLGALWETFKPLRLGRLALTSILTKTASKLHNIGLKNGKINLAGALPNALYIPASIAERNIFELLNGKVEDFARASLGTANANCIQDSSLTNRQFSKTEPAVDYIFVDPPFGGNLMYSELNFLWEAWLKVFTNNKPEAITNEAQGKGLPEYQKLMTECFKECYRVLKPGRWMTVEFHNSKNSVWNAIQEGLQAAGFVIADVRTLDKQQGSFNQVTQAGAVKQDLIISCYKPWCILTLVDSIA
jgi:adenine-specific DNA methylase